MWGPAGLGQQVRVRAGGEGCGWLCSGLTPPCAAPQGGPYHDMLHSILGAYTCYRPDVGYVQGMSFVAAVLTLNLDTADAFIAFSNLLNKPCQMAFFRVDHSLMLTYFAAFEVFFEENLPKLFAHFKKNNLTPDIYLIDCERGLPPRSLGSRGRRDAVRWPGPGSVPLRGGGGCGREGPAPRRPEAAPPRRIFTLYSKSLPLDLACRVWDVFCRDGEEFLFRTALGVLKLFEDILAKMDFIHIAQFLTRLPDDLPAEGFFASIAAIQMQSRNKKWAQVSGRVGRPSAWRTCADRAAEGQPGRGERQPVAQALRLGLRCRWRRAGGGVARAGPRLLPGRSCLEGAGGPSRSEQDLAGARVAAWCAMAAVSCTARGQRLPPGG
ncbi:TBC1 domain family member 14 [Galemys pyrenaicus]|uniref:TBC1 domain family member 14 n=1 Tax=Galemys pyrenaicus TaxID=202257 RepID=A0A8J6DHT8_GALPY|nr:TBC1 domain family member 14 [Galemys pyrenaicus]